MAEGRSGLSNGYGVSSPDPKIETCAVIFMGGFHKWGSSKVCVCVFIIENPNKMDDLGVTPFQETSYIYILMGVLFVGKQHILLKL